MTRDIPAGCFKQRQDAYYPKPGGTDPTTYLPVDEQVISNGEQYAKAIKQQEHPYNWGGVCIGLCYMLRHNELLISEELLRLVPVEWRPELARNAILGMIKRQS